MAPYRLVSNPHEETDRPPSWYVERYAVDGRTEIVSPLFLKKWQALAEAERLSAKESDSCD